MKEKIDIDGEWLDAQLERVKLEQAIADQWQKNDKQRNLKKTRDVCVCSKPGCFQKLKARGLCSTHYTELRNRMKKQTNY